MAGFKLQKRHTTGRTDFITDADGDDRVFTNMDDAQKVADRLSKVDPSRISVRVVPAGIAGHPKNDFGWQLRDLRLAFRRKDCDDAKYIVQQMARGRALTATQRRAILKLQHAVQVCERRQPDLGRGRRRRQR